MLQTLLKIGEQIYNEDGIWAWLTTVPAYDHEKTNWVLPILFDCVDAEIKALKTEMELFDPKESAQKFRLLNPGLWGPRGNKVAHTTETDKLKMLTETFFGKGKKGIGSFAKAIIDLNSNIEKRLIFLALTEINQVLSSKVGLLNAKSLLESCDLGKSESIVMFTTYFRSESITQGQIVPLHSLDGYEEFVHKKFVEVKSPFSGIDFVASMSTDDLSDSNFLGRYNINKVFQTTGINYAANFSDHQKSYQLSTQRKRYLDLASNHILNSKSLKTTIAGISHLIIPSLLNRDLENFDTELISEAISATNEFLFRMLQTDTGIQKNLSQLPLFWVNYIGYESDGNSFKIISQTNDVNSFYLAKLIEVFGDTSYELSDLLGNQGGFNLQSIYRIIPIRDGQKAKVNPVLSLFKDIFEQRPIDPNLLFEHFKNLLLCHRFSRYRAFSNIRENNSFDYAIKDAVFKYAAMFYALKHLNLIPMDTTQPTETAPLPEESSFQEHTEHLFARMQYTDAEKALFYLGRVLSSVAYAQYKKGHESKPVLNKLNFNGMDEQAMMRFSLDLAEKARQYNLHRETDFNFARFRALFNEKSWPLTKEQNLFYLLAGYTFHLTLPSKQS
ncbi:MAG: hypothetical protein JJU11_18745 [Candidatus Sumerlaeia bacterium]|nr:hypothetical protein [Candidatus Sumerlaeia bacterium]MCC5935383.1 hypothetical protein [Balneolales bacterium]